MIRQEHFELNGHDFIRTYSDAGMMIHGGSPEADYDVAEDPAELGRTYTETDMPIDDEAAEADKAEAFDILIGGAS